MPNKNWFQKERVWHQHSGNLKNHHKPICIYILFLISHNSMIIFMVFGTKINLTTWFNSSNIGLVCSTVQCSKILCITLQPYGCLDKETTWPLKLSTINCRWTEGTHSMHFWTTWFPFWSFTHSSKCPSSSFTMLTYLYESIRAW